VIEGILVVVVLVVDFHVVVFSTEVERVVIENDSKNAFVGIGRAFPNSSLQDPCSTEMFARRKPRHVLFGGNSIH